MNYTIEKIVICMQVSARMLELAANLDSHYKKDTDSPYYGQARLLRAAADDLAKRDARNDTCPHCNAQWRDHTCP